MPQNNTTLSDEANAVVPLSDSPLFTDRNAMEATCRVLQQLSVVKNEADFLKKRPTSWKMSFNDCLAHSDELKQAYSHLQCIIYYMVNGGSGTKKNERLAQLRELLHSSSFLQSIWQNPITSQSQCANSAPKGSIPKRPSSNPITSKPSIPTTPKTSKQPGKPKSHGASVKHGLDYNPEIDFPKSKTNMSYVTDFSKNANYIRIYIDEAWPGEQSEEYNNVGVISGIVWIGPKPDESLLPLVSTHLRENETPDEFRTAITNLLNCNNVFPFMFPVIQSNITQGDYPKLLRTALIVLLGWILPQDGVDCDVKIYCEGILSAKMEPDRNYADGLTEIRNTLGLTANRMQRWHISEFISMPSSKKEFEYIPYADALGYLTVPTTKAIWFCRPFDAQTWPGYVPLDNELLPRLIRLDADSPAGYADELFDFARIYQKTKIFYYVLAQASQKAMEKPDFRNALLERLEKMFEEKERDIPLLTYLCEQLVKRFSLKDFEGYPRQKLLRLLVEMQAANHKGKPEDARKCVGQYRQLRDGLLADNRELCAYTDMNVAVHCNDSFDFSEAADICRNWEKDPSFNYLSSRIRGMILSSIGQSYAFAGDCLKAHEYFINAIKIFENNHLDDEQDQTGVYCVHNALDCKNYPGALKMAETVFKCDFKTAIANLAGTTLKPYHHHILVKNLFFNPEAAQYRSAYISLHNDWQYEMQHPWELIELYRVFLLQSINPTGAREEVEKFKRVEKLWGLFSQIDDGATIKLIKAFAYCALARCCGTKYALYNLENELASIQEKLPLAASQCDALRHADRLKDEEFWRIIPFYYK